MTVSPETHQPILTGAQPWHKQPWCNAKGCRGTVAGRATGTGPGTRFRSRFARAEPPPALTGEQWLLCQILQGLTRDPKVHRFDSFRETVVYEGQPMPRLVALSAFGQQLSQNLFVDSPSHSVRLR